MANTYHQLYIQVVFPVKFRKACLKKEWRDELFAVTGNLINETGCKSILINGIEDHVHCLFSLSPSISLSEAMKSIKAKSSKWINEKKLTTHKFSWQPGFGAFSYGRSQLDMIYHYVENQEKHHHKQSFKEEYLKFLKKFGVDYNEKYIFKELI